MDIDSLTRNWALAAAAILGLVIVLFVLVRLIQGSARGRLAAELQKMKEREKAQLKARRTCEAAEKKLGSLVAKADSAKPRHIEEARAALQEAQEVQRLLDDQVLVVRNRVRTIILEEYPPKRQAALRKRLLGEQE